MSLIGTILTAVFVNNVVLNQLLGLCPFFEATERKAAAWDLGLAVCLVLTLTAPATWSLYHYVLRPLRLEYLQTLAYVLSIAAIVRVVELAAGKLIPAGRRAPRTYLPLLAANCAVLGVCLLAAPAAESALQSAIAGLSAGSGFLLASVVLSSIRSKLATEHVPAAMRGLPIALVSAGLMALAFLAFDRALLAGLLGKK
jgi:electron transport complex protein RnfA